ncbi:racemase [Ramlibacter sp. G-1-2-2]|uniref:Racemase n=1 Tax=Ramlibacter agri TaxID=2728837 RepID=A0A848HDM5_9BURK|nr:aspartate/glutamate racemase family protein [Ramlibacter agri]NML47580.1 racemase [Ramlibacter agri]
MAMKIWHQSFTTLARVPEYNEKLRAHIRKVVRPDTEVVVHGTHAGTHGHKKGDGPSTDVGYAYFQALHSHQFAYAAMLAEEGGSDGFAMATLPEPGIREMRSLVSIPVVGYGEASMTMALHLGQKFGVLLFIKEMISTIEANIRRMGLQDRCAGIRYVGFPSGAVLPTKQAPQEVLDIFHENARALIAEGADVIIPGEAPLSLLLHGAGIARVDDVPVIESVAAVLKTVETLVDMKRQLGTWRSTRGYWQAIPPRERVKELADLYGVSRLFSSQE